MKRTKNLKDHQKKKEDPKFQENNSDDKYDALSRKNRLDYTLYRRRTFVFRLMLTYTLVRPKIIVYTFTDIMMAIIRCAC